MRVFRFVAVPVVVVVAFVVSVVSVVGCSTDTSSSGGSADASVRDTAAHVPCSGADGSCCPDPAGVFTGGTCDSDLGGLFCPDKCGLTYECNGISWSTVQGGTSTCATDGGDGAALDTGPEASPDAPDDALVDAPAD